MEPPSEPQADSLAALEERVRQTAELVARLRRERDAALADQQAAGRQAAEARAQAASLAQELADLRAERAQVRTRVEKLLAQIDALAAG
jgi:uncharacterized coiled-coil DUF342 family protein